MNHRAARGGAAAAADRAGRRDARPGSLAGGTRVAVAAMRSLQTVPSPPQCEHVVGCDAGGRTGGAARLARRQSVDRHVRFDARRPPARTRARPRRGHHRPGVPRAATRRWIGAGPSGGPRALPVVDRARGRIAQDAVGLRDLLEERLRVALPEVDVGRIPAGEALVRPTDLHRRGSRAHLEHRVVVTHGRARGRALFRGPRASLVATSSRPDPRTRRPPRPPSAAWRPPRAPARAPRRRRVATSPEPRGTWPPTACARPGPPLPAPS